MSEPLEEQGQKDQPLSPETTDPLVASFAPWELMLRPEIDSEGDGAGDSGDGSTKGDGPGDSGDGSIVTPTVAEPWVPAPQDPMPKSWAPPKQRVSLLTRFDRLVDAPKSRVVLDPIDRLRESLPTDRLMGWIVTLVITGLAFFLRLFRISYPNQIMFDEVYYAKDAWSLLQYGYEGTWTGDGDVVKDQVAQGDFSALTDSAAFVVHPPLGKWLIAAGEALFGLGPFGWRFMALIFGTALVFMVIRLARRLSRSTLIGALAGVLLTVDGLTFVLSRLALLDIFQAFFIVAGVACVVADRDFFRNRLALALEKTPQVSFDGQVGPFIFRPWLILAGLMFGCGIATKWNSVYPLAVFGVLVIVWSWSARHLAGARKGAWLSLIKDGIPAFLSMVVLAGVTYVITWIPWLRSIVGANRWWGASDVSDSWLSRFGEAWGVWGEWHRETYGFHTGQGMAEATHTYASSPWLWPIMGRTVGIYADNGIPPGEQGCMADAASNCMRVVTALGTPFLWWAASIALVVGLIWWIAGMDWRFGVVVLGTCSTWIPWMFAGRGAMFSFYAMTMIPFMVIGLAMALGVILGPAYAGERRQSGAIIVGTIVAFIVLDFAFIYPILTGQLLTHDQWNWRMWIPGWV